MQEYFGGRKNLDQDSKWSLVPLSEDDCIRLEEVADLHFHASAYSSALDYYRQLYAPEVIERMSAEQALRLLRKAIDATILLGDFNQVDRLLAQADTVMAGETLDDPQIGAVTKAIFQTRRATALRERGRLHDALNLGKRAFSVLALTDMHLDVAIIQVGMGICYMRLGKLEKAEEFYSDGLATFRRIGHDLGVANILNNLALIHKIRCRWDKALDLLDRAVDLARNIGASHLLPWLFLNQGIVLQKTGRLGEARAKLEKGLRLAISLGDRLQRTRILLAYGRLEVMAGRLARAEELILEGKTFADELGLLRESVIADEYLGDVLFHRGALEKASFNYDLGLEKAKSIATGNDLEGELQRRKGQVHLAAGEFQQAVSTSQAALGICDGCGEDYEIGFCHLTLGQAYGALGDTKQTDHHFRQAIGVFHAQNLTHLWCEAIVKFSDQRLDSAGEAELLLLRRYLMDAQENGAATVSDRMLCGVLERLVGAQIRLGQFDDALLTVFELERFGAGLDDDSLLQRVQMLRTTIEAGLLGGVEATQRHLSALSSVPGLYAADSSAMPKNLTSVLFAGMERAKANSGFMAMVDPAGEIQLVARNGVTENLGLQLAHWFEKERTGDSTSGPALYSQLGTESSLLAAVPALETIADTCIFMPIGLYGRHFGLLFLGRQGMGSGFHKSSLDFLATYMGFLALFLHEKGQSQQSSDDFSAPLEKIEYFEKIITQSESMLDVLSLARKVAPSDLTVLLTGETGTGKGLLAYSIHALSRRSTQKFMAINCAAIPESLLESELFGHKKGSFTGAYNDKKGLLAEGEGGTVFLDEIGKMPLTMQGKLLQFMDTRCVRPVGDNRELKVDVRIICASKRDLLQMAKDGLFLEDLYYRLRDFPLEIPALRDRRDDIEILARHFVQRYSEEIDCSVPELDPAFLRCLLMHPWPGNVRELEKTLKRALILASGSRSLRTEHLPEDINKLEAESVFTKDCQPLKETLAAVECREIANALQGCGGNKAASARMLKISYPNLLKKIRTYGISC